MYRFIIFCVLIALPCIGFACGGSQPELTSPKLQVTLYSFLNLLGGFGALWVSSKIHNLNSLWGCTAFIVYPLIIICIALMGNYFVLDFNVSHLIFSMFLSMLAVGVFVFSYIFILLSAKSLRLHSIAFSIYVSLCATFINLSIIGRKYQEELLFLLMIAVYFISILHSFITVVVQRKIQQQEDL